MDFLRSWWRAEIVCPVVVSLGLALFLTLAGPSLVQALTLKLSRMDATEAAWRFRIRAEEPIPPRMSFAFEREDGSRVLPEVAIVDSTEWILILDRECVKPSEALVLVVHNLP